MKDYSKMTKDELAKFVGWFAACLWFGMDAKKLNDLVSKKLEVNMKTIKAIPQGGDNYNIFINDVFVGSNESESTFDAMEDYCIDEGIDIDDFEIIE